MAALGRTWRLVVGKRTRRSSMSMLENFVNKQKEGAQFVISAQMLRMKAEDFDPLAQQWLDDGGPGFNVIGVPHRSVVDGEFLITRVTVIRTRAALPPA
jgi:hypothetical protein